MAASTMQLGGIDPKRFEDIVLDYFKKRGFTKAEASFRADIANEQNDPSGGASLFGKGKSVGLEEFADKNAPLTEGSKKKDGAGKNLIKQPGEYAKGYEGLREFVNNSLDIYRPSFLPFLLPLFVHMYLELLVDGKRDIADDFLERFRSDHTDTNPDLIQHLASLRQPYHVNESEIAKRWRSERYHIRISERAKSLLTGWLQAESLGGDTDDARAKERVLHVVTERLTISYIKASLSAIFPCGLASELSDGGVGRELAELKLGPAPMDPKLAREISRRLATDEQAVKPGDGTTSTSPRASGDVVMADASSGTPAPDATTAREEGLVQATPTLPTLPAHLGASDLVPPSQQDLLPHPPSFKTLDIQREVELVRSARKRIRLGPEAYESTINSASASSSKPRPAGVESGAPTGSAALAAIPPIGVGKPSVVLFTLHDTGSTLNCAKFSEDATVLGGGFSESYIKLWNLKGEEFRPIRDDGTVHSADSSTLKRMRQKTGSTAVKLIGHSGPVYSLSFDPVPGPSGPPRYLLSSSQDATVRLWSLATMSNLVAYRGHRDPVWCVEWGPKGVYFATGGRDRTARVWSTERVSALRLMAGHLSDVDCVTFHPNSLYLATGSSDRTCRLWDVQRGVCVRLFTGHHAGAVNACSVSPDGRYLASGGADHLINLWDLGSGRCIKTMRGHKGGVHSLSWSMESTVLVSGGSDETVRVWDASAPAGHSANGGTAAGAGTAGATLSAGGRGAAESVLRRLSEGNVLDSKPGANVSLLPKSVFSNDTLLDTPDLLATLPTKKTPVFDVQFTPRNLCMAAGPMLVD